ncbi:MAG TPA: hypothetical protein VNO32_60545 [Candidatus Acidoferrum sp.]|nr:hypothetical protein [Candidatus Acidoferrum sp.]
MLGPSINHADTEHYNLVDTFILLGWLQRAAKLAHNFFSAHVWLAQTIFSAEQKRVVKPERHYVML